MVGWRDMLPRSLSSRKRSLNQINGLFSRNAQVWQQQMNAQMAKVPARHRQELLAHVKFLANRRAQAAAQAAARRPMLPSRSPAYTPRLSPGTPGQTSNRRTGLNANTQRRYNQLKRNYATMRLRKIGGG